MSGKSVKIIVLIFLLLSVNGCSVKEDKSFVKSIFQTNGATAVREQTDFLRKSIIKYYEKLNKRNPSYSSKDNFRRIQHEVYNSKNSLTLPLLSQKKSASYKDYLNIAFSESYVKERNDYLMLGIYKLIYWAYDMERDHTVTTMQYDVEKVQEANKMMQVIQYRIKTARDKSGNYLFLTWQRAWQLEVLNSMNKNKEIDLEKYSKKELLYPSNMSYQIISSKMIFTLQETLRYLGVEATNLSAQAVKSVFIFL